MKKIKLLFFAFFAITTMSFGQVKVLNNGNVGLGTNNPIQKLHVNGQAQFNADWVGLILGWSSDNYCPAIYCEYNGYLWIGRPDRWANHVWSYNIDYHNLYKPSDARLKENIHPVSPLLTRLKDVHTYTYNYTDEYFKEFPLDQKHKMQKTEYGFLAQEVQNVFPELICTDDTNKLSINYVGMIPVLTSAINELQQIVESKDSIIELLQQKMLSIENQLLACCSNTIIQKNADVFDFSNLETAKLYQNIPNPFSENTEIKFDIPVAANSARLIIHNMQGLEIKSYNITNKGIGNITIQGTELQAGMYMYTLLIDNTIVDTKRMILTK